MPYLFSFVVPNLILDINIILYSVYVCCALDNTFFMPPPLGAGGIMFSGRPSVRPSVRSLKYPLLTCTWIRWSTRPTVTVLQHVRPSVRPSVLPERFPGICRRMHGGIGLKFYMLMYLDHLQNWLVYGHSLLIFRILALFWLSETGISRRKHGGNGLKFCMLMYLDHVQNWLVYGYGLLIFFNFGAIFT